MATAILFLRNEVGQTEAASRWSGPTTTGRSALPGHGDGKVTTFAELISNRE
jgi:hypothetical protein